MPEENKEIKRPEDDPRFQKDCGVCNKKVFDPKALVSDKVVFCDRVCESEYRYEKRKVS